MQTLTLPTHEVFSGLSAAVSCLWDNVRGYGKGRRATAQQAVPHGHRDGRGACREGYNFHKIPGVLSRPALWLYAPQFWPRLCTVRDHSRAYFNYTTTSPIAKLTLPRTNVLIFTYLQRFVNLTGVKTKKRPTPAGRGRGAYFNLTPYSFFAWRNLTLGRGVWLCNPN